MGRRSSAKGEDLFYAIFAVVVIATATVSAMSLVPIDVFPPGALSAPAIAMAAGLLLVPILRIRRHTGMILRTEHVIMVGVVYWLLAELIQASTPFANVDQESVRTAFLAVGIFACGVWISSALSPLRPPGVVFRVARLNFGENTIFGLVVVSFCIGMFFYAYMSGFNVATMIEGLGRNRFAAPWSRGSSGGANAFVEHLTYFGYMLPSLTVLLLNRKGLLNARVIAALVFSAIMILFLAQAGGRRLIGVTCGAGLVTWILLQKTLKPRLIFGVIGAVLLLIAAMEIMFEYRTTGFAALVESDKPTEFEFEIRVDQNFYRLAQTVMLFPNAAPFVGMDPVTYALIRPVPRLLWPGKPLNPGYDLAEILGYTGLSLTHTVIGELFTMYGMVSVFFGGLFYGLLAGVWNKLLNAQGGDGKSITFALGLLAIFASLRSMQELILMSYGLGGWLVLGSFIARRRKKAARAVVARPI